MELEQHEDIVANPIDPQVFRCQTEQSNSGGGGVAKRTKASSQRHDDIGAGGQKKSSKEAVSQRLQLRPPVDHVYNPLQPNKNSAILLLLFLSLLVSRDSPSILLHPPWFRPPTSSHSGNLKDSLPPSLTLLSRLAYFLTGQRGVAPQLSTRASF
ncbi:hypothetical protein ASPBRDRAFT_506972 [Aspergillus brasiliensis CBS 101740]|uniref:Uncharacterized protein n=1 Tax=Aspergillus brasiliensis (strain CBS 101740 / IMI 381727 / IBT 21946) TaxID=767769 RepID=A0A1L9UP83_ASPBC|nr:hypothetical protein ASPBRDRAFT_506972 [Aspergillus brasiliensis CBS 101740]